MSGHSKWHGIKHRKAAVDAKRAKLWAKLLRAVEVAAREGGGNPAGNPTLADAVSRAKAGDVPNDTIDRAVKRGTGELEGVAYENLTYEGFAPGGAALLIDVLTDNRRRAAAEIRKIITRRGGNLGAPGSVAWMFERRGVAVVRKSSMDEDELLSKSTEAGADEINDDGDSWEVTCPPDEIERLSKALTAAGAKIVSAERTMLPSTRTPVADDLARNVLGLIDDLEDSDDVQTVYSNFDVSDHILEELAG